MVLFVLRQKKISDVDRKAKTRRKVAKCLEAKCLFLNFFPTLTTLRQKIICREGRSPLSRFTEDKLPRQYGGVRLLPESGKIHIPAKKNFPAPAIFSRQIFLAIFSRLL